MYCAVLCCVVMTGWIVALISRWFKTVQRSAVLFVLFLSCDPAHMALTLSCDDG